MPLTKQQFAELIAKHPNLQTEPPRDGIPAVHATREFGFSNVTLWRLIDAGKLRAGPGRHGRNNHASILVSRDGCQRLRDSETARGRSITDAGELPSDVELVSKLVQDFSLKYSSMRVWLELDPHPALGWKIRSGWIPAGRGASREDVATIVGVVRDPFDRRIGDNPGIWTAEGEFVHDDGRMFYTETYVYQHPKRFGLKLNQLPQYEKQLSADTLEVIWPAGRNGRWTRTVYAADALLRIKKFRERKVDGGEWVKPGELWDTGKEVLWTSKRIAARLGCPHVRIADLRRAGLLGPGRRIVPTNATGWQQSGGAHLAYTEGEVQEVLAGKPAGATTPDEMPKPNGKGGRPIDPLVAKVYEYCYRRWVKRDKLVSIRRGAEKLFPGLAPTSDQAVTIYATRYGQRHNWPDGKRGN